MRLLFAFLGLIGIAAAEEPLLLQKPTLNKSHIVFAYAGDLWRVPREGGEAVRLTSGAGIETDPAFSPDGTQIAFTGEYDGNIDVFVVPAAGGVPKRLTWHPAPDRAVGWTPDGKKIIFTSPRTAYSRFAELYTVPVDGGVEEKLPLPAGYEAAMSPDGNRSPTSRSGALLRCGRSIGAARRHESGWLGFLIAASRKYRGQTRTTSIPCGPENESTFCPTVVDP